MDQSIPLSPYDGMSPPPPWLVDFLDQIEKRDLLQRDEQRDIVEQNPELDPDNEVFVNFHDMISLQKLKHQYRLMLFAFFMVVAVLVAVILAVFLSSESGANANCATVNITAVADLDPVYGCGTIRTLTFYNFTGFAELPRLRQVTNLVLSSVGNTAETNISLPSLQDLQTFVIDQPLSEFDVCDDNCSSQMMIDFRLPSIKTVVSMSFSNFKPTFETLNLNKMTTMSSLSFLRTEIRYILLQSLESVSEIRLNMCKFDVFTTTSVKTISLFIVSTFSTFNYSTAASSSNNTIANFDFPELETVQDFSFLNADGVGNISLPKVTLMPDFHLNSVNFAIDKSKLDLSKLEECQSFVMSGLYGLRHLLLPRYIDGSYFEVTNTLVLESILLPLLVSVSSMIFLQNIDLVSLTLPLLTDTDLQSNSNIQMVNLSLPNMLEGSIVINDANLLENLEMGSFRQGEIVITNAVKFTNLTLPLLTDTAVIMLSVLPALTSINLPSLTSIESTGVPLSSPIIWQLAKYSLTLATRSFTGTDFFDLQLFSGLIIDRCQSLSSIDFNFTFSDETGFYITSNNALTNLLLSETTAIGNMYILSNLLLFNVTFPKIETARNISLQSSSLLSSTPYPLLTRCNQFNLQSSNILSSFSLPVLSLVNFNVTVIGNGQLRTFDTPALFTALYLIFFNNTLLCLPQDYAVDIVTECLVSNNNATCDSEISEPCVNV